MEHRISRWMAMLAATGIVVFRFVGTATGHFSVVQFYDESSTMLILLSALAVVAAVFGSPYLMLIAGLALFWPGGVNALRATGVDRVPLMLSMTYVAAAVWIAWNAVSVDPGERYSRRYN